MAPFTQEEFNWMRPDVQALVNGGGFLAIMEDERSTCQEWLRKRGYSIDSLDCRRGIEHVIHELGILMDWKERFGLTLEEENRNLDGLNDGFKFDVPLEGGHVLELVRPDLLLIEDQRWTMGMFEIAHRHSIFQLAFGKRFFIILAVSERHLLSNITIREIKISQYNGLFRS